MNKYKMEEWAFIHFGWIRKARIRSCRVFYAFNDPFFRRPVRERLVPEDACSSAALRLVGRLQARRSVCISARRYMSTVCAPSLSHGRLCATFWTAARQAPLSMGLSRQENWSGLPCPPPGRLPHPGMEPMSPVSSTLWVDSWLTEPLGKPEHLPDPEQMRRRSTP